MANPEITVIDIGRCVIEGHSFTDESLVFTGEHTYKEGTLLARRSVGLTPTIGAITRAGSSNGTVTNAQVVHGPKAPLVGIYTLTCIEAVANGGVWKLVDPNDALVAADLIMTPGAGAATTFEVDGLVFTITDGTTDFSAGDTVNITVAPDGKVVPFSPGGAGGAQFPIAVLPYDAYKDGAGNLGVRVLRAGIVNSKRLIIDADGNGNNITAAHLDRLHQAGIHAEPVQQLSGVDNT